MLSWTCLKEHPRSATVWRALGQGGALVLKQHRHPRPFAQELRAYRDWLPRLAALATGEAPDPPADTRRETPALAGLSGPPSSDAPGDARGHDMSPRTDALAAPRASPGELTRHLSPRENGPTTDHSSSGAIDMSPGTCHLTHVPVRVPALLAFDLSARALALAVAPGERLSLAPGERPDAHAAAGRFLRDLHALQVADDDPVPLRDAIATRLAEWHARADGLLSPTERDALQRLAGCRDAFTGVARVPCHRDFTPDNWLLADDALHVLDFEHARLDAPEADLVKLRAEVWSDSPALEHAFLGGHGPLSADATARLDVLLALHAVATLAWAQRHADVRFQALGRQALAVALASA